MSKEVFIVNGVNTPNGTEYYPPDLNSWVKNELKRLGGRTQAVIIVEILQP